MSGIWSAFACCFPRKRTRHDEGEGSETNSLLAHSVHEDLPGANNNKPQSIVSYEAPQPGVGSSTVGYGAVGQGHAVLGEEGRLRVQSIASAVENRMISINHPAQSNLTPHYSQSRRPTPSKQDMPPNRSTTSSPASLAEEPVEAPPVISLPPAETSAGQQSQDQDANANARPDLGRSRSSTSSSFSQTQQAQIEGVRRVNLNLGGMWERERERERSKGGKKGSVGSAAAAGGTIKSNASVKSTGKKDKEDETVTVAPAPAPAPAPAKVGAGGEAGPSAQVAAPQTNDKPIEVEVETETEASPAVPEAQPTKDQPAAVVVDHKDVDKSGEEEPMGTTTPGSENKDGGNANGGGGKSGRGKKKKNRGRGRGRGGKGGR